MGILEASPAKDKLREITVVYPQDLESTLVSISSLMIKISQHLLAWIQVQIKIALSLTFYLSSLTNYPDSS